MSYCEFYSLKHTEKHKFLRFPKKKIVYFLWPNSIVLRVNKSLRKKWPCSELLWSEFSCICTEYGKIQTVSPYSVQMRENADQNNSEYGNFSRSEWFLFSSLDRWKSGCVRRESWRTFWRKEKKLNRIYSLLVHNLVVSLLFCLNLSLYFCSHHISTEAVTEGVLQKRCSQIIRKIHRKTPMS